MRNKVNHYLDKAVECPVCHRTFRNAGGLSGHLQFVHSVKPTKLGSLEGPDDISGLKEEVEMLQLLKRKRALEDPPPAAHYPEISELVGAGQLAPEVKTQLQSKMLGITQPAASESLLAQLVKNPQSIDYLVKAAKGIMGVQEHTSGGFGALGQLARDIGVPPVELLRSLFGNDKKVPDGTKVYGLDVGNLPTELAVELIREEREDRRAAKGEKRQDAMIEQFGKVIEVYLGERGKDGGHVISQKAPAQEEAFTCECGESIGYAPGATTFTCPKCSTVYVEEVSKPAQAPKTLTARPLSPEGKELPSSNLSANPEATMICSCGQSLDVTGLDLLSTISCPVCGELSKVTSPDVPVPVRALNKEEVRRFQNG
jgi:predicted RNA-binding Zn-ribbon protein involved in translation (DUF1610 family)